MSAFILPLEHFQAIVTKAQSMQRQSRLRLDYDLSKKEGRTAFGQMLVNANFESVNYRYKEKDEPFNFVDRHLPNFSAVDIAQALRSFDYQSCEVPDWESSEAKQVVRQMLGGLWSEVPGYETAPWVIDAKTLRERGMDSEVIDLMDLMR